MFCDQADALSRFQGKLGVIEQGDVAERKLRRREGNNCHIYEGTWGARGWRLSTKRAGCGAGKIK
jgi:hypothetical protein